MKELKIWFCSSRISWGKEEVVSGGLVFSFLVGFVAGSGEGEDEDEHLRWTFIHLLHAYDFWSVQFLFVGRKRNWKRKRRSHWWKKESGDKMKSSMSLVFLDLCFRLSWFMLVYFFWYYQNHQKSQILLKIFLSIW